MYVCGDLPQTRLFDKIVSRHVEKYLWQTEGERQNKREEKRHVGGLFLIKKPCFCIYLPAAAPNLVNYV